jgi:hypothetical protein
MRKFSNFNPPAPSFSLPPLQLSSKFSRVSPQASISIRSRLYFSLRTSSKFTINSPLEALLPSHIASSTASPRSVLPTAADLVMSSQPPASLESEAVEFKFSRLFTQHKDRSFLRQSTRARPPVSMRLPMRRSSEPKPAARLPQHRKEERKQLRIEGRAGKTMTQGRNAVLDTETTENLSSEKISKTGRQSREKMFADFALQTTEASKFGESFEAPPRNNRRVIFNKKPIYAPEDFSYRYDTSSSSDS